jgi:hypothetical protein
VTRWHGAPKPPPELWEQMEAAGKAGDEARLGLLRAQYRAWLADQKHRATPLQIEDDQP